MRTFFFANCLWLVDRFVSLPSLSRLKNLSIINLLYGDKILIKTGNVLKDHAIFLIA